MTSEVLDQDEHSGERNAPTLRSLAVRNFKAVRNSGSVRLRPLNVLIGNNGSGKSSLIEAARAYQCILAEGVDEAFADTLGFEHVWSKVDRPPPNKEPTKKSAMHFRFVADHPGLGIYEAELGLNAGDGGNRIVVEDEHIELRNSLVFDREGTESTLQLARDNPGKSVARNWLGAAPFLDFVARWQFLILNPETMGRPRPQSRTGGRPVLAADGSNVAEVLLDLAQRSPGALDEVVEAMSFVLPYASELRPELASDRLERRVYLQLYERIADRSFDVPGWLFSTGTLRVLALVMLLKDPEPPPVIFVEEIENGLDPRTVGLVVDLLRSATESGRTQVIATSHSPYLLDLLELDDLVLCQRDANGAPRFMRAGSDATLKAWSEDFSPGRLYTMGRLQRAAGDRGSGA